MQIIYQTLVRELDVIKSNFQDADKLRERYGLNIDNSTDLENLDRVATFMARMRQSLRGSGIGVQDTIAEITDRNIEDLKHRNRADEPGV